MTLLTLVSANLEYGNRNRDLKKERGTLLTSTHPDILCIQESLPERTTFPPNYKLIGFNKIPQNTCLSVSERIDIYLSEDSPWKSQQTTLLAHGPKTGLRPTKIITLKHQHSHQQITIANVHLVGGRYDEHHLKGNMLERNISTVNKIKNEALNHIIPHCGVDLVAGDFNSDLHCFLKNGQLSPSHLSYFQKVSPGKNITIYQEWNTAPFKFLQQHGFHLAIQPTKNEYSSDKYTSIYNVHPDAIWHLPQKLQLQQYGILDLLTPNLSDHNGLYAVFKLL